MPTAENDSDDSDDKLFIQRRTRKNMSPIKMSPRASKSKIKREYDDDSHDDNDDNDNNGRFQLNSFIISN